MHRKPRSGELKAQSLKVIGDALNQTYQDVVDQKIPANLVELLDTLARNEKSAPADAAIRPSRKKEA